MKYASLILAVFLAVGFAFADNSLTTSNVWDGVKLSVPGSNPVATRSGGETCATATVITSLPYQDIASTVGAVNNYEYACPYTNTAPDVVYSYTPATNQVVTIDMCGSYYDTHVFVYAGTCSGTPIACNDDYCSGPNYPSSYLSYIDQVSLTAGVTYYIVVNGYSTSSGTYDLKVIPYAVCETPCPVGGIAEGEPACGTNYVDAYNGGCNSTPHVFQDIQCVTDPIIYCGTSGNYINYYYSRDTDWYQIQVTGTQTITATVEAEFNVLMFLIDGNPTPGPDPCTDDWASDMLITYGTAGKCVPLSLSNTFAPGTYWIWVGPSSFYDGIPCSGPGSNYVLQLDGYTCPTATENTSWGQVKGMFR